MTPIIIGIDHGYAVMKTAHCSFQAGVVAYEHRPFSMENVLELEGKGFERLCARLSEREKNG